MARLKAPEQRAGMVPRELLDVDHRVWRDPAAFGRWCQRHGIAVAGTDNWAVTFARARDAWAIKNDMPWGAQALTALGVPYVGSLARAQARVELRAGQ